MRERSLSSHHEAASSRLYRVQQVLDVYAMYATPVVHISQIDLRIIETCYCRTHLFKDAIRKETPKKAVI